MKRQARGWRAATQVAHSSLGSGPAQGHRPWTRDPRGQGLGLSQGESRNTEAGACPLLPRLLGSGSRARGLEGHHGGREAV